MAAVDKDTLAAQVAVNLIRSDLAKKHPEAAAAITDEYAAASVKLAKFKAMTPPPDPRFPAQNVSQYCWAKFNTYIMCMNHFDGTPDVAKCHVHKRHYLAMCPEEWQENFKSYISEDRWIGVKPKNSELFE